MKKVILTGFEPFGEYKHNPTQESAKYFNMKVVSDVKVIGLSLPCTYYGAFNTLARVMEYEQPDAIISTGLSSSVRGIRIETAFRNIMNGKYPDASGSTPNGTPISSKQDSPEFLVANTNHSYLVSLLKADNIPVELSVDAEGFICNSLGYLTTQKIMEDLFPSVKNMFIHIPWTDDYKDKIILEPSKIFLEKDKYYRALKLLIEHI
jgi:pyroglutamyl-peptidase